MRNVKKNANRVPKVSKYKRPKLPQKYPDEPITLYNEVYIGIINHVLFLMLLEVELLCLLRLETMTIGVPPIFLSILG